MYTCRLKKGDVAGTHILYAQQQLHQVNRVVPVCAERIDPVPTEIQHVCNMISRPSKK